MRIERAGANFLPFTLVLRVDTKADESALLEIIQRARIQTGLGPSHISEVMAHIEREVRG